MSNTLGGSRRRLLAWPALAAAFLTLGAAAHPAIAQSVIVHGNPTIASIMKARVQITPTVLTASGKFATFTLTNPTADTIYARIGVRFARPADSARAPATNGLVADAAPQDSAAEAAARREAVVTDSLEPLWSMASWVENRLPEDKMLLPHQSITYTLRLAVPKSVKPGEYWVYLSASPLIPGTLPPLALGQDAGALSGKTLSGIGIFMPLPEAVIPPSYGKLVYKVANP